MTRAALLARVSTAPQAGADRHSMDAQGSLMEAYAEREGWEVVARFDIPGESAYRDELADRPMFAAVIAAAERREFDVLMVYDLSRFSRSKRVLHDCLYRLRRADVRLVGAYNGIDYTSDDGDDWAGIEGVFASRSSREHGRRVRHAKEKAFEDGYHLGAVPFGYARVEGRGLRVAGEAEAVRRVFEMRIGGASDQAIADWLNGSGLRPRSRRGYTGFTAMSARELWRNVFYAGFVKHKGERRPGRHEAIVSLEMWAAAQPRGGRRQRSNVVARTLLQGVAFCASCEGKLWLTTTGGSTGSSQRRGRENRRGYLDVARLRGVECGSGRRLWMADEADEQVSATMRALAVDGAWLRDAARRARKAGPVVEGSAERRVQLEGERERVTEAYMAGALSRERWRERLSVVEGELGRLPENVDRVLGAVRQMETFGELWDVATLEERREAVGIVFRRVLLDLEGREVRMEPKEGYGALFADRAGVVGWVMGSPGFEPVSRHGLWTPASLGVRVA